jgi:hypothetical protein
VVKKALIALCLVATAAVAQESDTDRRIKELERQIDIISRELEALKTPQKQVIAETAAPQLGLGAAASKVYRAEPGVSIGGYGEFAYAAPQHGAASADVTRAVLYTGYKFNPKVLFNSELEVEHATTELSGAVSVEFAYLDYLMHPSANVRAGLVLLPMGLINEQHEPTAYLGVHRPEVEDRILPTTWSEIGVGVFGDVGNFTYRGYVVTGLESSRFSAEEGVHEGKQSGAEASAEDLAVVGRLDWRPFEGTFFGGSIYTGNSGQGADYRGRVTLAELHADSKFRGVALRALAARGHIGDAAAISDRVGQTIGSSMAGWYAEGGYELGLFTPYLRYERADTRRRVASGFTRDPETDRRITTLGVAFKPISQTVIKTEVQRIRSDNQFNIGLGYIF